MLTNTIPHYNDAQSSSPSPGTPAYLGRYRGTSLTTKCTPPGPYCRPMPTVGGSYGGGCFLLGEVPLYCRGLLYAPRAVRLEQPFRPTPSKGLREPPTKKAHPIFQSGKLRKANPDICVVSIVFTASNVLCVQLPLPIPDEGAHACSIHVDYELLRVQGYLAHKKLPPPYDHRRALGIGLL